MNERILPEEQAVNPVVAGLTTGPADKVEWKAKTLPPGGEGPLYRQLADMILAAIGSGEIQPDSRLPTVRDLSEDMKLSRGTVKHAYDELEHLGAIEKVQGRGTFVRAAAQEPGGKKDRAMQAIDSLLDEMEDIGFSTRETQIFFSLKLREREEKSLAVRVAVVDCNPEALRMISTQIERMPGTDVQRFLLDDIATAPMSIDSETELVVTTATHYDQITALLGSGKVSRVALSPSQQTVAALAKLMPAQKVGIATQSDKFARIIARTRISLGGIEDMPRFTLGSGGDIGMFLAGLDTIIVPDQFLHICPQEEADAIRRFQERDGSLISFTYHIDAGSLMYLELQIGRMLAEKR